MSVFTQLESQQQEDLFDTFCACRDMSAEKKVTQKSSTEKNACKVKYTVFWSMWRVVARKSLTRKLFIYPHKNPLKNKNTNFLVQSKKNYTCVYVAGCGSKANRKQSRNSISASTTTTQLMWHLISPLPQRLFWSTTNLVVKK